MNRSVWTHFGLVSALHLFLLVLGGWQLSQTDLMKSQIPKLGDGGIKIGSSAGFFRKYTQAPTPKITTTTTTKKSPVIVKSTTQEVVAAPVSNGDSISSSNAVGNSGTGGDPNGSEFGNARIGTMDKVKIYQAELRSLIDKNKSYPTMSRRLGQTGTVVVGFTLMNDGRILNPRIEKASPYERLNDSALEAVKKVNHFKPFPTEMKEEKLEVSVPLNYKII